MRHVPIADLEANAAELTAAMDAGEEIVVTIGGRDYRLEKTQIDLPAPRQQAMKDMASFREKLRVRGVQVSPQEVRGWIDEGRP